MSRVAKAPVHLPAGVELQVEPGQLTVKGPHGSLTQHVSRHVQVIHQPGQDVEFKPFTNDPSAWAHAGTARALLSNMVQGVTSKFSVTLELVGVGYRAQADKHNINLSLGFSHPIKYALPEGVQAETPNNTTIILRGIDKQLLGQVAAKIRQKRPPEPYKGKGVRYAGEIIVKKEAKKK